MSAVRHWLGLAGFVVGGAGAVLEHSLIVWAGIGILSSALCLRAIAVLRGRRTPSPSDSVSAVQDE
jgi:hypothetical protein